MRVRACAGYLTILSCFTAVLAAQGLATKASRDDWEEINFEFNSSVLADGFPSLLRLVDVLNQYPAYKVSLNGYADSAGTDSANSALSKARAEEVKAFLVKQGARASQINTTALGSRDPVASNSTREGRFMNRRVKIVVTDEKGKDVGPGLGLRIRPVRETQPSGPRIDKVQQTSAPSGESVPGCFAVQIGTFRERANAERLIKRIGRESLSAQLRPWGPEPPLWRVLAGCEPTEDSARGLAERLGSKSGDAHVVRASVQRPGL